MSRKPLDQENAIREIRRQLNEHQQCFEFRTEGKLSLLSEMRDLFRKRGEIELEYAKNLERLCERFEKSTKQRNIKNEVRSTFNLWSTLLAETRRMARDRASLAETIGLELVARIDIMSKDVNFLAKKCKDMSVEIQETFFKDLKELNEQTKVYQYACHHSAEAHNKLVKSREKVDAVKNSAVRKKKAEEKEKERLRQFNEQKHRQLKCRNEYLLKLTAANYRVSQYFGNDVMDLVELMDHDYHESFNRLAIAYHEAEQEACQQVLKVTTSIVDQTQALNFENDLHYFLSGFSSTFTQPPEFSYVPYGDDDVSEYKVNTKDVFLKTQEMVKNLSEEVQTLKLQKEGDIRTIEHVNKNNLRKYRVQTVDDAIAVLEEMGDAIPPETTGRCVSLERGNLVQTSRAVQVLHASQKGKDDTLTFTIGAIHRKLVRGSQQRILEAMLDIMEKSLSEQKVPPVSIGGDYRVPKLFGGDCLEYIMATGCVIPLIIQSCCHAIEKEGTRSEGLFRVPGPAQQIEDLKKGFEEGRDPLMYSSLKGIEITAVASVLKLYFRELSNPLFPIEKYYDFINCTRKEDPQERLELLRNTINSLHPAIVTVMRYLFSFLYRMSLLASETKMNSPNLALVFGPTLTRAPNDADPRLLHNDVPAINVLIQLCIERYEYLFGPDAEDEGLSSPPPPPEAPIELDIVSSPPPVSGSVKLESTRRADTPDSFTSTPPPTEDLEEPPPPVEDQYQFPEESAEDVGIPPEGEKEDEKEEEDEVCPLDPEVPPVVVSTPEVPTPEEKPTVDTVEDTPLQKQESIEDNSTSEEAPKTVDETTELPSDKGPVEETPPDKAPPTESNRQISTTSMSSFFEKALDDITASIDSMKQPSGDGDKLTETEEPTTITVPSPDKRRDSRVKGLDDDDEEGDSDSDSEEVMTITAKALYDYSARNEKELSFEKGCVLDVIEKTPDGNWWDGYLSGKRGYIPVSYVEIAELQSVPTPPARKSSMQSKGEESSSSATKRDSIVEKVIEEKSETPPTTDDITPEVKSISSIKKEPEPEKKPKPPAAVKSGKVSKLTQQFQSPTHTPAPTQPSSSQPPRVLFNPHRRVPSTDMTAKPPTSEGVLSRSGSGGNKTKPAVPPPIRPKPDKEQSSPASTSVFPLMSHDGGVSASPLQQAHLQQVVGSKKPAAATPLSKKGSQSRSSSKKKPALPSKPTPPPKTGATELQAELAAATRRRKQDDETS